MANTDTRMSNANSFIQKLLPKDKRFFPLFDEFGAKVKSASALYSEVLNTADHTKRSAIVDKIADLESQGDKLVHKIVLELTATFITPFDREDIHRLASNLDAVLDDILAAARRLIAYKIEAIPAPLIDLGRLIAANGAIAADCLHTLKSIKNPREFAGEIREIQTNKAEADDIFLDGMAELYRAQSDSIQVMKLREVYLASDGAQRNFQDLSFALEAILIKTT